MSDDLTRMTAAELSGELRAKNVSATEVTQAHLDRIAGADDHVHAFLHVATEQALAAARSVDDRRAAGEELGPLAGVPVALKDVFTTTDMPTTAGSKILNNWQPPYDATITTRLRDAGAIILGKTNMDEFAMGSSTENSAFGPSHNPWDLGRIPGGSSGGSAAAVAAYEAPLAIGTDTGGSIRQPAAVVRHHRDEADLRRQLPVRPDRVRVVAGHAGPAGPDRAGRGAAAGGHLRARPDGRHLDPGRPRPRWWPRPGRPTCPDCASAWSPNCPARATSPACWPGSSEAVELLESLGAKVTEVSCPHFRYALPAYYLIAPSECSSNLARFDAMRYGLRVGDDGTRSAEEVMALTREAGFGAEVKRRIMLGTYALSSGYYDAYYGKAQQVRTLIARDFEAAFGQADVLVSPTTPTTAFRIGERADDPMAMYLADLATIPSNLAGNAALSVPCGLAPEDGLPVGLQIMAPVLADDRAYRVAAAAEAAFTERWGHPLLAAATGPGQPGQRLPSATPRRGAGR